MDFRIADTFTDWSYPVFTDSSKVGVALAVVNHKLQDNQSVAIHLKLDQFLVDHALTYLSRGSICAFPRAWVVTRSSVTYLPR